MLPIKTCGIYFSLVVLILGVGVANPAQPPKLFFYPPPHRLADGQVISSPVAVEPAQVAEDFPDITEMSGVVVPVYWSRLCPEEHHCDFSLIDHALDYWGRRGKTVVVSVVTFGHPMTVLRSGTRSLETPTPEWLLRQVKTFTMEAPPIVPVTHPYVPARRVLTTFPSYWDRHFLSAIEGMLRQLARYDGNPTVWSVRIGTGIMGEDNPSFDGLRNTMPGWSNIAWIKYCRSVADAYLRSFKRTRLEFDIARLGWISANGTAKDRAAANALIDYLNGRNVFLAMNGFDTDNIAQWKSKAWKNGTARSLEWIASRERSGNDAGLEGAPLFVPLLKDVDALAAAFREIGANRLVLFSDVAGALNYERNGPNSKNETTRQALSPQTLSLVTDHAKRLLGLLGFKEKYSGLNDKASPPN
jgi:hypothetical protein